MTTLLILLYAALAVMVFRFLRVPPNEWTISTAVLGGIVLIGSVVLLMDYNQPFTDDARTVFRTTPIFSTVSGRVVEVPVQPNVAVKQGDVLFVLDRTPFENRLAEARARLAASEETAAELQADYDAAAAATSQAKEIRDNAKDVADSYEKAKTGGDASPFSRLEVAAKRSDYLEAQSSYFAAQAAANKAKLALSARIDGVNPGVFQLQAAVAQAEFELEQATVRAPTDGFVTQVSLEPGMVTTPMPLRPVLVFVHSTGGENPSFVASFDQSVLQNIVAGSDAEILFDAVPGRIFKGRVTTILPTIAQGQLEPTGDLIAPELRVNRGTVLALIDISDDLASYALPAGASAQVAVYSDKLREVGLIRRLLLRMKSWLNFVVMPRGG